MLLRTAVKNPSLIFFSLLAAGGLLLPPAFISIKEYVTVPVFRILSNVLRDNLPTSILSPLRDVFQTIFLLPYVNAVHPAQIVATMLLALLIFIGAALLLRSLLKGICTTDALIGALNHLLLLRTSQFQAHKEGDATRQNETVGSGDTLENSTGIPSKIRNGSRQEKFSIDHRDSRWVRFCDVGMIRPLRVVTTNIQDMRMKLWSEAQTPHAPVAKAVAASMALPLAFRPVMLDGKPHCDGGLTSNLPAWAFDAEHSFYPDSYIIAIETDDSPDTSEQRAVSPFKRPFSHFGLSIRAALFGARELELRGTRRFVVGVPTRRIGLLDFNMSAETLQKELNDCRRRVRQAIDDRVYWRQINYSVCKSLHDQIWETYIPQQ